MHDEILRTALAPEAECLSVEQVGRYADGMLGADEQTAAALHIRQCLSCQAELALLRAVTADNPRAMEADVVRAGVASLKQRSTEIFPDRMRPAPGLRRFWSRSFSVALAAVVVIGIALSSTYILLSRKAPQLPSRVTTGDEVTRSLAVAVRGPIGDQVESPRRFEWRAVDRAVRYRVRLLEVDRHEVWSATTSALGVDLPPAVRTSIAPAKTLLWDVTAYDATGAAIAESGPQSFRLIPR